MEQSDDQQRCAQDAMTTLTRIKTSDFLPLEYVSLQDELGFALTYRQINTNQTVNIEKEAFK